MDQYFFTQLGNQTQRKLHSFAIQVEFCNYENLTMDFGINSSRETLMDLGTERNIGVAVDDEYDIVDNNPDIENDCDEAIMTHTWNYNDEDMLKTVDA